MQKKNVQIAKNTFHKTEFGCVVLVKTYKAILILNYLPVVSLQKEINSLVNNRTELKDCRSVDLRYLQQVLQLIA